MKTGMLTYLNDPSLKARFLAELTAHEQADQLIKGTYGRMNGQFRGCGVGCSLHSLNLIQGRADANTYRTGDHARYEEELGIPLWLAYLEDHLFEGLPLPNATAWPRQFALAIPVGKTIPDTVLAKMLRWSLGDGVFGARHTTDDPTVVAIVDRMIALFDREIAGDSPTKTEWDLVERAARAAWDARAVWDARAAWDAWDARDARAAWDARAVWDARAAWDAPKAEKFYPALRDYVLQELRAL